MVIVAVVVGWIALSALVGLFAYNRGRDPTMAVVAALVLSPVFGFLLIAALKDKIAERRHAELLAAIRDAPVQPDTTVLLQTERNIAQVSTDRSESWVVLVIGVIVVAVLVLIGVSQLGTSANATFTTISGAM